jgi:hypothetical protein
VVQLTIRTNQKCFVLRALRQAQDEGIVVSPGPHGEPVEPSATTSTGIRAASESNLFFQFNTRFAVRSYRRAICAVDAPACIASAATRFLNAKLHRRRGGLGFDAMRPVSARVYEDTIAMFEWIR